MSRQSGKSVRKENAPDEARVLADIRYFQERLGILEVTHSMRDSASTQIYRLLIRQRRQLLAAIRDGAPERWPEYSSAGEE